MPEPRMDVRQYKREMVELLDGLTDEEVDEKLLELKHRAHNGDTHARRLVLMGLMGVDDYGNQILDDDLIAGN